MGLFARRRPGTGGPALFPPSTRMVSIEVHGANPVAVYRTAVLDACYGAAMAGTNGAHIQSGDPQVSKRTGDAGKQQNFAGAMQLQNLVGASLGLNQAVPATKPNVGAVGVTAMQHVLEALNNPRPGA